MTKLVNTNINENRPSLPVLQARAAEVAVHLGLLSNSNRLMVLCHLLEGEQSVGALQAQPVTWPDFHANGKSNPALCQDEWFLPRPQTCGKTGRSVFPRSIL